ncbi:large neutral amino acids transporter small subunit 3 isoform X4 [Manis javanica]
MLNLGFTIGSFVLSATTLPLGILMDRFGPRPTRLVGSASFAASCTLMALASRDTKVLSPLIFLALSLNGFGGICLTFSSLTLPNMFGNLRSTFMALMIGSYASSAITFPGIKLLYDAGVAFVVIMFTWSGLACLIFLNCALNWPNEPFPAPEEVDYTRKKIKLRGLALDHKVTGDRFYTHVTAVGQRLSQKAPSLEEGNEVFMPPKDVPGTSEAPADKSIPFRKSLCSPIFLWSLLTMGMTQLRVIFYMAAMNKMLAFLVTGGQEHEVDSLMQRAAETVGFYSSVFGAMQLLCLLTCPLIGYIMDWQIKDCVDAPTEGTAPGDASVYEKPMGCLSECRFLGPTSGILMSGGRGCHQVYQAALLQDPEAHQCHQRLHPDQPFAGGFWHHLSHQQLAPPVCDLRPAHHGSWFLPLCLWGPVCCGVPIQPLRDADGPAVTHQCCVCPAPAAALYGHGGTLERRALLGESGPPAVLAPGIPATFLPPLLPCPAPEGVLCPLGRPAEGAQQP